MTGSLIQKIKSHFIILIILLATATVFAQRQHINIDNDWKFAFGNAANKIILNGGGLLDPNLSLANPHAIQVLANGGWIRLYGNVTAAAVYSGPLSGSGPISPKSNLGAISMSKWLPSGRTIS